MRHLLSILTALTLLTTTNLHAQPPSYVPTNGLVGWWPFNGNANDESGNGNNGVVNGATLTQDRFGNLNCSYDFEGQSNYIQVDDNSMLDLIDDFTLSSWVYLDSYNTISCVISKKENWNQQSGYVFGVWMSGGDYILNCQGAPSFDASTYIGPNGFVGLGNWNLLTSTFDNSSNILSYYVNGNYTGQLFVDFSGISDTQYPLIFGALGIPGGLSWYVDGKIDDIGIWNRALTPAEIQALYTAQPLTPCVSPDPVSFTGLGSSYTLADAPVTLSGTPAGGVFIGPGVTGSTFSPAAAGVGTHSVTYTYVDGTNCINTAGLCTEVTINAGIGGNAMTTGGVRVFPNPNRGQFTVELVLNGLVGLQVFDARGALVHNEVFTASGSRTQRTLDLSAFAKGSYTLQVEHDGQRVSQTVVVE